MFNECNWTSKTGTRPLIAKNDPLLALSLLTRLPVKLANDAFDRSAQAAWAYPLVGFVTGALSGGAGLLALWLGLPSVIAAILCLVTGIIITGAMHEDGLADCADGFWGGWDPEMRLKIMKDSQIGTYGVLALLISFSLRLAVLTQIFEGSGAFWTVIAVHVAARAVMPGIMALLPLARDNGLSARVGSISISAAWVSGAIGAVTLLVVFGPLSALALVAAAFGACLIGARIALAKIKGQTGDVIGAHQQVTEITLYLALIA